MGIALGSMKGSSFANARVDSADSGSHEDASLFCTSASLEAKNPEPMAVKIQTARTTHLVTRPVSVPAS